jgi:hypothetical protein
MLIDALADALVDVWQRLQLPLDEHALAASGSKSFESTLGPVQNWGWHTPREDYITPDTAVVLQYKERRQPRLPTI